MEGGRGVEKGWLGWRGEGGVGLDGGGREGGRGAGRSGGRLLVDYLT
jgi:hypothetical protein